MTQKKPRNILCVLCSSFFTFSPPTVGLKPLAKERYVNFSPLHHGSTRAKIDTNARLYVLISPLPFSETR
jgi:hypothetical protein